ncbi:MAG: hypothetical protein ABGY08_03465 [Gammaproteobacteria bacterium]
MKLEFLIPASPTDEFCAQIAMFRHALDTLGGIYYQANLVAVFGDAIETQIPDRWQPYFKRRINICWVEQQQFNRYSYFAQGHERFLLCTDSADLVFMCDADTCLIRPLTKLIAKLSAKPAIAGLIAHLPPIPGDESQTIKSWNTMAQQLIGKDLKFTYQYTLVDPKQTHRCPCYFNAGFVVGTPALLKSLHASFWEIFQAYQQQFPKQLFFAGQVSMCLAMEQLNLPFHELSMRYNYPNDERADKLFPIELENVVLMHYLREKLFDRRKIFTSERHFNAFLELDLSGSNKVFQSYISKITDARYPF